MSRAERLSTRLDTLLDAVFQTVTDARALFGDIAEVLQPANLAQAQNRIRKTLRREGEISTDAAVITACVLHRTGFPAHRMLRYLSLYVRGKIRLSLFQLAVDVIFPGELPIPASLLYDLTQYTYLEKRLLVRKGVEISEKLKPALGPELLLYLYLLALRDDLSNENIQLITLVMKECSPALDLRTRIGGASLEEYGDLARAWRDAEQRSLELEPGLAREDRSLGSRPFDRDSASAFLDKYFSDEALAEMRASASPATRKAIRPRKEVRGAPTARSGRAPTRKAPTVTPALTPEPTPTPSDSSSAAPEREMRTSRKRRAAFPERPRAPSAKEHHASSPTKPRAPAPARRDWLAPWRLGRFIPTALAAVAAAVLLLSIPSDPRPVPGSGRTETVAAPEASVQTGASATAAPQTKVEPPAAPATATYVVKPGDSLWKIFSSMRARTGDRKGWEDFLSTAQSMNRLRDPDLLQPGKVLTISVQK